MLGGNPERHYDAKITLEKLEGKKGEKKKISLAKSARNSGWRVSLIIILLDNLFGLRMDIIHV